jgi:hypothetical protein
MFWECIVAVCINCHCVDHNGQFRDTPSDYKSSDAKMLLEGCTECNKATDIKWNSDIACPVRSNYCEILSTKNPIPKPAFRLEDTVVSFNANIHDVVVGVSANQLSENHRHLMVTSSLERGYHFLSRMLTIGVPYALAMAN